MRILRLRFENINSLLGKWEVDFTDKEFIENGLFSIVGPTGSGKSSILDAITLGLYGQTPRQKSISSKNEVMTYGTAICSAVVTFEVNGIIYRSYFEQKRAHGKLDGQLQAPRFSLYKIGENQTEESLTEKITETSKKIIDLIGLNYEQFTKAVMLPQGAFSRFLTSADDERAKILEQISGSSKYRVYSKKVFEREKREKAKLNSIEEQIQNLFLLTKEEEESYKAELQEKETFQKETSKQILQLQEAISWLNKINELQKASAIIVSEIESLKKKEEELNPKKVLCEKARRALEVEVFYKAYQNTLEEIKRKEIAKENHLLKIKSIKKEIEFIVEKNTTLEKEMEDAKKIAASKVSVWDQVNELDSQIKAKKKEIEGIKKEFDHITEQHQEEEKKINQLKQEWEKESSHFEFAKRYIEDNKNDEMLSSDIVILKGLFDRITEFFNTIQEKKQKLEKRKKEFNDLKQDDEKIKASLENHKNERESFLEQELDSLSAMLREHLQENTPCSVCGSLDHPYHEKEISEIKSSALENIERLKKLQEQVQKEQNELIKLQEKLEYTDKDIKDTEGDLASFGEKYLSKKEEIVDSLKKYTLAFNSVDEIPSLMKKLENKKENYDKCKNKMQEHQEKKNEYQLKEQKIQSHIEGIQKEKLKIEEQRKTIEEDLLSQQEKRKEIFGEKRVESDRQEVEIKRKNLDEQLKQVTNQKQEKEKARFSSEALITSLEQEIKNLHEEKKEQEEDFNAHLRKAEFETPEDFLSARMDSEECRQIEKQIQDNQKELNKKNGEYDYNQKTLQAEKEKKLTEKSLDELNTGSIELTQKNKVFNEEIIGLRLRLEKQKENEKTKSSLQNSLEKQRHHHRIWENLNKLIGSAQGDRFSRFVQGITLKMLTRNANQHLKKLNPRYSLTPQETELTFQLHDSDFGEIRTTSNISGGETFQISLSLALGLSSMASNRVRLDTLFLDEGFGTLDSKTLQMAVSLLSNLRQEEGKLIGVITHVESLKEEIETQINVLPIGNGHSRIQGPGVKKW